jgi:hypothetical protein
MHGDILSPSERERRLRDSTWQAWMAYLDHSVAASEDVSPSRAIELFRRFLRLPPKASCRDILSAAAHELPIDTLYKEASVAPGSGRIRIETDYRLSWQEDRFVVELGRSSPQRTSFVRMHELAHAILYSFLNHPATDLRFKERYQHRLRRETFCNAFARDLLLPRGKTDWISLRRADDALSQEDHAELGRLEERARSEGLGSPPRLTFQHLRVLAGRLDVSIRCLISGLYRHSLLDEAACGLAVMRVSPNRVTGQQTALRIWQMARPSWGFVILNQRVARQGFLHADEVYKAGQPLDTELRMEELRVFSGSAREERPKTREQVLATVCAYTPVDVQDEGRYLVAIWTWPRPQ